MPNLASARSRSSHGGGRGGDDEARTGGNNQAWYGIGASAVTLLVFCTLAATVGVWIAFASAGLSLVAFALASGLAPASWRVGANDAVSAESEAGAALPQRRFGLTEAAINALPTFQYELNGGDLEAGVGDMCSVCLEDVQAGDRVRQLPACRHLFHVECIDMWLHSHRTCPVCRCNLSPPEKVPGKTAAAAPAPAALATEMEPPADNAESQV